MVEFNGSIVGFRFRENCDTPFCDADQIHQDVRECTADLGMHLYAVSIEYTVSTLAVNKNLFTYYLDARERLSER